MEGSKNPEWLYLRELFDVLVPASLLVYAVVFKSNNIDDYIYARYRDSDH